MENALKNEIELQKYEDSYSRECQKGTTALNVIKANLRNNKGYKEIKNNLMNQYGLSSQEADVTAQIINLTWMIMAVKEQVI